MRLIDADKLKAKVRAQEWKRDPAVMLALDWIYMLINEQPTIDAMPVVRGEWREDYVYTSDPHDRLRYKCSVCGRIEYIKEPFCNCGAKMGSEGST